MTDSIRQILLRCMESKANGFMKTMLKMLYSTRHKLELLIIRQIVFMNWMPQSTLSETSPQTLQNFK